MNVFYINDASFYLPGAENWDEALPLLTGEDSYTPQAETKVKFKPSLLPPNERRRASESVRLAFSVCEELFNRNSMADVASVFASSDSDTVIFDKVCRSLCSTERQVSPTLFHNSVHNAPAGYWSIAAESRAKSTSIAAGQYTVAQGIIDAATQAISSPESQVLLACYDICPPPPINQQSQIRLPMAFALLISAKPLEKSIAKCSFDLTGEPSETNQSRLSSQLIELNPIAQGCELLCTLATNSSQTLLIPSSTEAFLRIKVENL